MVKIEEYGSLPDANRNTREVPVQYDWLDSPLCSHEKFELSDTEMTGLISGLERFEQRLGRLFGLKVDQGLWVGDRYIFYGSGHWDVGPYYGVRKLSSTKGSWVILGSDERGGEAQIADSTNRFEDAWKEVLAEAIRGALSKIPSMYGGRRMGIFFNCIPPQVEKVKLTEELAWEIYDPDAAVNNGASEKMKIDRARRSNHSLWRSLIYPDAWVDSVSTRLNTPASVWGFNLSCEDFVDLAFDWALSPEPLDGTPLSEVNWAGNPLQRE